MNFNDRIDLSAHKVAIRIARNVVTSKNQSAYLKRKAQQYGSRVVMLARRYVVAIQAAERLHPDRCQAHIDGVAMHMIMESDQ